MLTSTATEEEQTLPTKALDPNSIEYKLQKSMAPEVTDQEVEEYIRWSASHEVRVPFSCVSHAWKPLVLTFTSHPPGRAFLLAYARPGQSILRVPLMCFFFVSS